MVSEEREQGTVKWFNVNKGFGFITQSNGDDIFVHYRSIRGHGRKKLIDGQAVTYTVINSNRGLQADDVEVIG
ncbi:MAG: cold-shock protein [Cellvibrionales bacterium]|nr:cold-shock protein [Cellvibrionales bacterium]